MKLGIVGLVLAGVFSSPALSAITVTPSVPTPADTITIGVESFPAAWGSVTSASIARLGNTFAVQQNVEIVCSPIPPPPGVPSPFLRSEFVVGPLAPGTYNVNAIVNATTCGRTPYTQTASFSVTSAAAVPMLDGVVLLLLGVALAATALVTLNVRT